MRQVNHHWFEVFIISAICLNVSFMAGSTYPEIKQYSNLMDNVIENVFFAIYNVEMALKLFALYPKVRRAGSEPSGIQT